MDFSQIFSLMKSKFIIFSFLASQYMFYIAFKILGFRFFSFIQIFSNMILIYFAKILMSDIVKFLENFIIPVLNNKHQIMKTYIKRIIKQPNYILSHILMQIVLMKNLEMEDFVYLKIYLEKYCINQRFFILSFSFQKLYPIDYLDYLFKES